ncbi:MAG TPA: DUF4384 domain-containing protein [Blastocatellia bacterium]|jgi:hypothetical protein|nr:DUF4384 domain-containing protein [Blastocatellia bacterium]
MKTLIRLSVIALFALTMSPSASLAQARGTHGEDDEVALRAIRQKVRSGEMAGMEVILYEVNGDKTAAVLDPGRVFKNSDELRLEFKSSIDGYVYLVNVSPNGKKAVIFPDIKFNNNNKVEKGKTYRLPEEEQVLGFKGDDKGDEIIQVIMSRDRINFFEKAIKESDGELGKDSAAAAAELVSMAAKRKSGIQTDTVAKVLPRGSREEVMSREIRLKVFTPKDKDEQGTVIAIPDGFKEGAVAVFEIRIRHL